VSLLNIGVPVERKEKEFRVSLLPKAVKELVDAGHNVFVESNAGLKAGFSNEEYENAGAIITDSVWDYEMVVKVKSQAKDPCNENQILMAYLHVEKGQSPELLEKLLKNKVQSYAFEEIRDKNGTRLVNLGYQAGVVGTYEGLRVFGKQFKSSNNPFKSLLPIKEIGKKVAYEHLSKLNLKRKINIVIMGDGNVARGAKKVLGKLGIKPQMLGRQKTLQIENYLPKVDILINAVNWNSEDPHIVTKEMLGLMKKTALIVDISCDEKGAVQTCIPTTWDNPTYKVNGITHFCIDNLPTAIPRGASKHLSSMILPFVLTVANDVELKTGLMTKNGEFEFKTKPKIIVDVVA